VACRRFGLLFDYLKLAGPTEDRLIAIRLYHDFNPPTGEEYKLRDRMLRKACGSFALVRAGELPGDPEVEEPYSLDGVFNWYRDCPEQISRAVIR
jgi:hypothetical protein